MDGRQRLGAVLILAGFGAATVGGIGLAGGFGAAVVVTPTGSPVSTAPAATSTATLEPISTLEPTATFEPTATPTENTLALVTAFFERLQAAIRSGTETELLDSLGQAVLDRYGRDACAADLASKDPVPEQVFEVLAVHPPAPWDYVTDGLTTTVQNATTVDARVTAPDATGALQTVERQLHVQIVDGSARWFTDCGSPLSAP